uniref:Peptidase M16 N-terminal domain-containing protein n=2 Tax=Rhizochromulina marina TaxID=1034831 RepID=A0A7S2WHG2_9STRA
MAPLSSATSTLLSPRGVVASPFDERSYAGFTLPNGIRVLVVRDQHTKLASAALTVGVGAAKDPMELPGLAHFTEHMSMQGSAAYPEDNAYKKFINKHGGKSNAATSMEHTTYKFQVADTAPEHEALLGTLDIFSSFFSKPLFNPDFVSREVKAIDAEDSKNRINDERRLLQVLRSITNPECSFSKYSTGSFQTLWEIPAQAKPPLAVHEAMREFHRQHYTPGQMGLVVVANASLVAMEGWVRDRFTEVGSTQRQSAEEGQEEHHQSQAEPSGPGAKDAPAWVVPGSTPRLVQWRGP